MGRFLKRNKGTEAPSNLIFVDTESYKEDRSDVLKRTALRLRLWCATRVRLEKGEPTRRKEADGLTPETFWQFVSENSDSQRTTWIFAHNACHDLTQLAFWKELDEGRFVTTPMKSRQLGTDGQFKNSWMGKMCLESSPFWLQVRDGSKTYKFVDTFNYWQMKLAEIGRSVGIEKVECDTDNSLLPELLAYCKNDVAIIERAVCQLIKMWTTEDCGVFQPTSASLAMTNFRHTCPVTTSKSETLDLVCEPGHVKNVLERESYFGGRIQAFYVGERHHRIYHLDCNSLYPYVMSKYLYPRRFVGYKRSMSLEELRAVSKVYGVVARVCIKTRFDHYPVRVSDKQYHCTGRFWTVLAGRELIRSIDVDSIDKIGTVQLYSVADLFSSWVGYWYGRKVQADRFGNGRIGDRNFCKLILNSLSGKWAQHGRNWRDIPNEKPIIRWGGYPARESGGKIFQRHRGVGGNLQILSEGKEPEHAFPLISACITANAREYMREVISVCPERSVYYMATDSIICNADAYEKLRQEGYIDQTALGKFKVVGVHEYVCIHGPNDYVLGERQVVSGHIGKARVDSRGNLKAEIWDRAPTVVAKGPQDEIIVTEVPAYYPHHTNRGRVGVDGWWEPYRIQDDLHFTDRPRQGSHFGSYFWDTEADRILPSV